MSLDRDIEPQPVPAPRLCPLPKCRSMKIETWPNPNVTSSWEVSCKKCGYIGDGYKPPAK